MKCLECSVAETTMMLVGVLLVLYSPTGLIGREKVGSRLDSYLYITGEGTGLTHRIPDVAEGLL